MAKKSNKKMASTGLGSTILAIKRIQGRWSDEGHNH